MNIIRLPRTAYTPIFERMQQFTLNRDTATDDELWMLEHEPVYTQGLAGKAEHILNPVRIPVIHSDRGGQVTYHGPGQLMAYTLFDLGRLKLNTRCFVAELEKTIIDLLAEYHIHAYGKRDAPGVYIDEAKIASIGLRVKRDYCYHGIALNVNMDLTPFNNINPCGFEKLTMTHIAQFIPEITVDEIMEKLARQFLVHFEPS